MLARMVLTCCAADGRPIKVGLAGEHPDRRARGHLGAGRSAATPAQTGKDPINEAAVPYLEVTAWQEIAAPKQPYE